MLKVNHKAAVDDVFLVPALTNTKVKANISEDSSEYVTERVLSLSMKKLSFVYLVFIYIPGCHMRVVYDTRV